MDWTTITVGILALCAGIYFAFIRVTAPHKSRKLQAMKQNFGDAAGTVVHTIAYSVVPIIAGIIFIVQGSRGLSLF